MRIFAQVVVGLICIAASLRAQAVDVIFASGFENPRWVLGYYVGYERDL